MNNTACHLLSRSGVRLRAILLYRVASKSCGGTIFYRPATGQVLFFATQYKEMALSLTPDLDKR